MAALPCHSFEDAFAAVRDRAAPARHDPGRQHRSPAGWPTCTTCCRAAGLHIVGEHFVRVNHQLLGVPGATLARSSRSRATSTPSASAANSCAGMASGPRGGRHGRRRRRHRRAPATRPGRPSPRARGRDLRPGDPELATSRTPTTTPPAFWSSPRSRADRRSADGPVITSFTFRVRNLPAALYKALGGFATNGVNMVKLESYMSTAPSPQAHSTPTSMGHPEHAMCAWRSRSCGSSPTRSRSWASTRPTASASGWVEPATLSAGNSAAPIGVSNNDLVCLRTLRQFHLTNTVDPGWLGWCVPDAIAGRRRFALAQSSPAYPDRSAVVLRAGLATALSKSRP